MQALTWAGCEARTGVVVGSSMFTLFCDLLITVSTIIDSLLALSFC